MKPLSLVSLLIGVGVLQRLTLVSIALSLVTVGVLSYLMLTIDARISRSVGLALGEAEMKHRAEAQKLVADLSTSYLRLHAKGDSLDDNEGAHAARPTAADGTSTNDLEKVAAVASIIGTPLIVPADPASDAIIAEDVHQGVAANHPSYTKKEIYVMKVDPSQPLVAIAETGILFQAYQAEDKPTYGNVLLSTDYGESWTKVYEWTTPNTKKAKRRGNWHAVELAPVFKKDPQMRVDEVQIKFENDGRTEALTIERVAWVRK